MISPDYFKAMGIPLLRGRSFTLEDREKSPMVAIVDQKFVDRYFPDQDPIGKGLDIGNGTDGFYKIVGVVGSVLHDSLDGKPSPTMYIPYTQDVFSSMWVVVRAKGEPTQLSAAARQAVRDIDNGLPGLRHDAVRRRRQRVDRAATFFDATDRCLRGRRAGSGRGRFVRCGVV